VNSDIHDDAPIKSGFVGLANATFGERRWHLVEDGATVTRAPNLSMSYSRYVTCYLNCPHKYSMGAIKRRLQWDRIQTREEAIRAIHTVWPDFQQGSIDDFVASFSNRVQMVREADRRTIQPLISSGKTTVPPGCAMEIRTPPVWNDADDERLLKLVAENGRKWRLISRMFEDMTEVECKSRWMVLSNQRRLR
jgi:hypothetical protein